jgi:O-acetyl-ADP-ribose deacetylase (regulator of RNase III)
MTILTQAWSDVDEETEEVVPGPTPSAPMFATEPAPGVPEKPIAAQQEPVDTEAPPPPPPSPSPNMVSVEWQGEGAEVDTAVTTEESDEDFLARARGDIDPVKAPEERGWWNNSMRIIGDRLAGVGANVAKLVTQLEDKAEEKFGGLGGIYFDESGVNYASPDEWQKMQDAGEVDLFTRLGETDEVSPFGAEKDADWEEMKRLFKEEGVLSGEAWLELGDFAQETGVQSVADMLAISLSLPLYVAQWAVDIGRDRAKNQGEEASLKHTVDALPWAAGAAALEKFGVKGITGAGRNVVEKAGKEALDKGVLAATARVTTEGGRAARREAGTEFAQEQIEYAGEVTGTPVPFNIAESLERGAQGAVGGGAAGGAGGTAVAGYREITRKNKKQELDIIGPVDDQGKPLQYVPESQDSLEAQLEAMQEGHKQGVLVTTGEAMPDIPDGYTATEIEGEGTLIHKEGDTQAVELATSGRMGTVLGYGTDTKPEKAEAVIVVKDAKGRTINEIAVDDSNVDAVIEAQRGIAEAGGAVNIMSVDDALASRAIDTDKEKGVMAPEQMQEMAEYLNMVSESDSPDAANQLLDTISNEYGPKVAGDIQKLALGTPTAEPAAPVAAEAPATVQEPGAPGEPVTPVTEVTVEQARAQEIVPTQSDTAAPDNTPLARELAGGLNTFLNEDKKIRSVTSQKGRARNITEGLGLQQSPLMERIDLVDSMLGAIAAQLDTLAEQGYNIKPLRDIFVRNTPKGKRRIGLKKAREGGVLRNIELKQKGRGISAGIDVEALAAEDITAAEQGGVSLKQTGRVTNVVLDDIVQRINDKMTEVMETGPAIKTGAIPGAAEGKPKISKKAVKKVAPKPVEAAPTKAAEAKQISQFRAAEQAPEPEVVIGRGGTAEVSKKGEETRVARKERLKKVAEKRAAKAKAPKVEEEKVPKPTPKKQVEAKEIAKKRTLGMLHDTAKEKAAEKLKAQQKKETQQRKEAKEARQERMEAATKILSKEDIARVEAEQRAAVKATEMKKVSEERARKQQAEKTTEAMEMKRKEAEKKRRDAREAPGVVVPETVPVAERNVDGQQFYNSLGQIVTATGKMKARAGEAMIQVFTPWTVKEQTEQNKAAEKSGNVPTKGKYDWLPEYALQPITNGIVEPPVQVTKGKAARNTVDNVRLVHPNAGTAKSLKGEQGNILNEVVDAVVSPANSNGDMNGGIDKKYMERWPRIESIVKAEIVKRYGKGQMPIGDAFVVKTGDPNIPNLIVSPTMAQAGGQTDVKIAGLATMAALKAADDAGLKSVTFPGMGTGIGKLNPQKVGVQMELAQDYFEAYQDGDLTWEQALRGYRAGVDVNDHIKNSQIEFLDAKPAIQRGAYEHKKAASREISPDKEQVFTGDMQEMVKKARQWQKDVLAEAKADGRKLVILFHGTAKNFVEGVSERPKLSNPNNAHRITSGGGIYATPNPADAIQFAGQRYGGESTGIVGWAWYADEFAGMMDSKQVSVGEMTYISDPRDLGSKAGRITEYFFDPKIIARQYDVIIHRSMDTEALVNMSVEERLDILDGRNKAATLMEQQYNGYGEATADNLVGAILSALHTSDPLVEVLNGIINAGIGLSGIDVRVVNSAEMESMSGNALAHGAYVRGRNKRTGQIVRRILMGEAGVDTPRSVKTLVHELVHAATTEALKTDNKFGRRLNRLFKHTKFYMSEDQLKEYGFTNIDEFIAEALTNEKFQRLLASIPPPSPSGASAWTEFGQAIMRLLGIKTWEGGSALSAVYTLAPDLMMPQNEIEVGIATGFNDRGLYITTAEERTAVAEQMAQEMEEAQVLYSMSPGEQARTHKEKPGDIEFLRAMHHRGGSQVGTLADKIRKVLSVAHPSQVKRWARDLRNGTVNIRLANMAASDIQYAHEEKFEGMYPDKKDAEGRMQPVDGNPLRDYFRAIQKEVGTAGKLLEVADKIDAAWRKWERLVAGTGKAETLNRIIVESTAHGVDPSVAWMHPLNKAARENRKTGKTSKEAHARLRREMISVGHQGQLMYKQARDFYKSTFDQMRSQVVDNMLGIYELDGVRGLKQRILDSSSKQDLKEMPAPMVTRTVDGERKSVPLPSWDKVVQAIGGMSDVLNAPGPYFPQMRFGEYVYEYYQTTPHTGYASRSAAGDAARTLRSESLGSKTHNFTQEEDGTWAFDHTETGFGSADSQSLAEDDINALRAQGFETSTVNKKAEHEFSDASSVGQILAMADKKLKGKGDERNRAALREALITMLPETSMQKRMLRKKNIKGASEDGRRVLANYAQSAGKHLARLKHRKDVDKALIGMEQAGKKAAKEGRVSSGNIRMTDVYNEINKRHNMDDSTGTFAQFSAKASFLGMIFSPSFAFLNATQTIAMTLPVLSGEYGTGKTLVAMAEAYKHILGPVAKGILDTRAGLKGLYDDIEINELLPKIIEGVRKTDTEMADMLQVLMDRKILDATFSMEISETAKGGKKWIGGKTTDVLVDVGRTAPYIVEIMNRSASAMAAIDLERQKNPNSSVEEKIDKAHKIVSTTQVDYSMRNRPRWWKQNDLTKIMTIFKMVPLAVYMILATNTRKLLGPNATLQQRKEGARTFAMIAATQMILAGGDGLFVEPIRILIGAIAAIFDVDEDDDDLLSDPDMFLRNLVYDITGSESAARVAQGGVFALAGSTLGQRASFGHLFFMHERGDTWAEELTNTIFKSLMGPMFGQTDSVTTAFAHMSNGGSPYKTAEYLSPKIIKDPMKAYRYSKEGMTDFNGNPILEPEAFDNMNLFMKFFGMGSTTESDTYTKRNIYQETTTRKTNAMRSVINRYKNMKDKDAAQVMLDEYNEGLSSEDFRDYGVRMGTIRKSERARRKQERFTEGGVPFRNRRQQAQFERRMRSFKE